MQEEIIQLKNEMMELLNWMRNIEAQQIQFPVGSQTKSIIQKDMLVSTGVFGQTITTDCFLEVNISGVIWWLGADEL